MNDKPINLVQKSDFDKEVGLLIKKYREAHNLTQEVFSEKIGISLKYISRFENGYSGIKQQTLINTMNLLGISPNMIYEKFITNEEISKQIQLSHKLQSLSGEKLDLAISILDLLIDKEQNT